MSSLTSYPINTLQGRAKVGSDKSISHRSLLFASLSENQVVITDLLQSQDVLNTLHILTELGVTIKTEENNTIVEGVGLRGLTPSDHPLDCGNSGTAMRLLSGILAAQNFTSTLIGDASLMSRPMDRVIAPLSNMGAIITSNNGRAPLVFNPPSHLSGIKYNASIASAQVKSALLLAGLYAKGKTSVLEPIITRGHTEDLMQQCSIPISKIGDEVTVSGPVRKFNCPAKLTVPADISSASFFLLAAHLVKEGKIILEGVSTTYSRSGIIDYFCQLGADIAIEPIANKSNISNLIINSRKLDTNLFEFTPELVSRSIDEIPAIAVAAAMREGVTTIRHCRELRVKESDRIKAVTSNLIAMGKKVEEYEDGMTIYGDSRPFKSTTIPSFSDHRIAMAFAIAGASAEGPVIIQDVEPIATSFPNFVKIANDLGANIVENE